MTVYKGKFNSQMFFNSLDSARISKKLNWKGLAEEAGVQASTLTRMSQGKKPDVDTLAVLSDWAGLNPSDFINKEPNSALSKGDIDTLAAISSQLSNDPNLDDEGILLLDELIKTSYDRLRKK